MMNFSFISSIYFLVFFLQMSIKNSKVISTHSLKITCRISFWKTCSADLLSNEGCALLPTCLHRDETANYALEEHILFVYELQKNWWNLPSAKPHLSIEQFSEILVQSPMYKLCLLTVGRQIISTCLKHQFSWVAQLIATW